MSDLTYDLRSGPPDFMDKLIGTTFANIAMDLIGDGQRGRMTAIQDGKYVNTALPKASAGARRVDIQTMYNTERFRPKYANKLGLPLLLIKH